MTRIPQTPPAQRLTPSSSPAPPFASEARDPAGRHRRRSGPEPESRTTPPSPPAARFVTHSPCKERVFPPNVAAPRLRIPRCPTTTPRPPPPARPKGGLGPGPGLSLPGARPGSPFDRGPTLPDPSQLPCSSAPHSGPEPSPHPGSPASRPTPNDIPTQFRSLHREQATGGDLRSSRPRLSPVPLNQSRPEPIGPSHPGRSPIPGTWMN